MYDICGSDRIGKLGWGGYYSYIHILVSRIVLFITGLLLIGVC